MYFRHPECLPYLGTWTVYFIMGNHVYVIQALGLSTLLYRIKKNFVYAFQSPGVSPLFSDLDCLLCYAGLKSQTFVYTFHSLGVSPLFRDSDWLLYNEKLCLHYSVTWTVYTVQA